MFSQISHPCALKIAQEGIPLLAVLQISAAAPPMPRWPLWAALVKQKLPEKQKPVCSTPAQMDLLPQPLLGRLWWMLKFLWKWILEHTQPTGIVLCVSVAATRVCPLSSGLSPHIHSHSALWTRHPKQLEVKFLHSCLSDVHQNNLCLPTTKRALISA